VSPIKPAAFVWAPRAVLKVEIKRRSKTVLIILGLIFFMITLSYSFRKTEYISVLFFRKSI